MFAERGKASPRETAAGSPHHGHACGQKRLPPHGCLRFRPPLFRAAFCGVPHREGGTADRRHVAGGRRRFRHCRPSFPAEGRARSTVMPSACRTQASCQRHSPASMHRFLTTAFSLPCSFSILFVRVHSHSSTGSCLLQASKSLFCWRLRRNSGYSPSM